MAAASGCSLTCSTLATSRSSVRSSMPPSGSTVTSVGFPSVSVPVLSTTTIETCSRSSSASALRNRTPTSAARPAPTMIDIGVASPSAHGQAMISTATAFTSAWARRGSGPNDAHTKKVATATSMTTGTNHADTLSARRWIGARDRCASLTIRTICASSVSRPDAFGDHDEGAGAVDRAAGHLAARCLFNRDRLARHHRLVHGCRPLDHDPVHRDSLSGTHAQAIARVNVFERHVLFRSIRRDASRRLRCERKQLPNRARSSGSVRAIRAPGRAARARR